MPRRLIDGGGAPHAPAGTAGRNYGERMLDSSGRGIQLVELGLHQGTIAKGRGGDVDRAVEDGRGVPDEGAGWRAQGGVPQDAAGTGVERIETGVAASHQDFELAVDRDDGGGTGDPDAGGIAGGGGGLADEGG